MSQQREEHPEEILIFIIDESYGHESRYVDTALYEDEPALTHAAGQKFLNELKTEFDQEFEDVNVGPGADIPAFVTVITNNIFPLIPWLMALFFSGKPIVENVEAWRKIFGYMKRYFTRDVLLNRQGAAVLAVEAVFTEMDGIPKSIRMLSYRSDYRYDEGIPPASCDGQIDKAPPTLNLSMVRHVFEIEADGVKFLTIVDGRVTTTQRST
ncbi:hypothetical protein C8J34_104139 [Rhizobium sp. PP-F2F-G36]|nr:hypothetical protein C8J34_104139 [Rhizobium sp. PP-F2F-G36]